VAGFDRAEASWREQTYGDSSGGHCTGDERESGRGEVAGSSSTPCMKLTLNPDPYNPKGPAPKFDQPVKVSATRLWHIYAQLVQKPWSQTSGSKNQ
jgi:hypothetical protein